MTSFDLMQYTKRCNKTGKFNVMCLRCFGLRFIFCGCPISKFMGKWCNCVEDLD